MSNNFVASFKIGERVESQHMPVILMSKIRVDLDLDSHDERLTRSDKIVWDRDKMNIFIDNLNSDESAERLEKALSEIDSDVDAALNTFADCMLSASDSMRTRFYHGPLKHKHKYQAVWFDSDCSDAKKKVRVLLKRYIETHDQMDRPNYTGARNDYVTLLKEKKKSYARVKIDKLVSSTRDSSAFWKEVRLFVRRKKKCR